MKLSIIIPAYNEEKRLQKNVKHVIRFLREGGSSYEVILVDDGSTDGTYALMNNLSHDNDTVRIIHYTLNKGKGHAIREGVMQARGEYTFFMDADGSTPIEVLPTFLKDLSAGIPIVIGSRHLPGSTIRQEQPLYRRIMGRAANFIIRLLLLPGIRDTQCGFKGFHSPIARELFQTLFVKRWGFDFEILTRAQNKKIPIRQVPVVWLHAKESRIRPIRSMLKTLLDLFRVFVLVKILKR